MIGTTTYMYSADARLAAAKPVPVADGPNFAWLGTKRRGEACREKREKTTSDSESVTHTN